MVTAFSNHCGLYPYDERPLITKAWLNCPECRKGTWVAILPGLQLCPGHCIPIPTAIDNVFNVMYLYHKQGYCFNHGQQDTEDLPCVWEDAA